MISPSKKSCYDKKSHKIVFEEFENKKYINISRSVCIWRKEAKKIIKALKFNFNNVTASEKHRILKIRQFSLAFEESDGST